MSASPQICRQMAIRGLNTAWLEGAPPEPSRLEVTPILFMIHGFPDTAAVWDMQTAHFEGRFQVIAPFVRGAGPSEPAPSVRRYGVDAVALDHLAILKEVDPTGRRPIFLLGHDLGAVHAWHLAGLLKGRAKALVTINGLPIAQFVGRWRRPKQWLKSWYMFLFQVPVLPELVMSSGGAGMFRRLTYRVGGLTAAQVPAVGDGVKALKNIWSSEGESRRAVVAPMLQYRAFFRSVPGVLKRGTPRLECPVLSLWGEGDPFLLPPTYDELAGVARRLTVRIIAGGHWLNRERPDEVNRVLEKFYADAQGQGS